MTSNNTTASNNDNNDNIHTTNKASSGPCESCGTETTKECSQCKAVFYCCRDCQKREWKVHKKSCFPPGSVCTRCQEVINSSGGGSAKCLIPHPDHLQQGAGSSFGAGRCSFAYFCSACESGYTRSGPFSTSRDQDGADNENLLPITKGKQWCFEGTHTIQPLPPHDERRVCKDVVVLTAGPDLSKKLKELDGNENVRVLKLKSGDGMYDSDSEVSFQNIRLPNLEEFQSLDVNVTELTLTPEFTPKVRKIWMQNPTTEEDPDYKIICPELRDCSIYYWGPGDDQWVNQMLEHATLLEAFDSYKLRVGYLKFSSNHLKKIRLHRAELLTRIDLWAPRLTMLDVQAAYDLEEIHFLSNHPLKQDLPSPFVFTAPLQVNTENALLGGQALASLEMHPRVDGPRLRAEMEAQQDGW